MATWRLGFVHPWSIITLVYIYWLDIQGSVHQDIIYEMINKMQRWRISSCSGIIQVSRCPPAMTHLYNARGCKYSLNAPDDGQKYRSKHVEQPRNKKLSYTVAYCWSFSYIIYTDIFLYNILAKRHSIWKAGFVALIKYRVKLTLVH
jgi:hypothetical protein